MGAWELLLDVLIMLVAALAFGTVAERLGLSAILGYLVAGTLVGPNVLGLVQGGQHVRTIAELGVSLLLFTIGLEFSWRRLRKLGRVAFLGGSLQVILTLAGGTLAAALLGLPLRVAVALGAMVALSSTACVLRLLVDRGTVDSMYGRHALGILLLQDVAVIPLMLLVVTLTGADSPARSVWALLRAILFALVLVVVFLAVFKYSMPRLFRIESWIQNREFPILFAVVLALGSAFVAHAVSLSPALGAFVAGVLLGESPFASQVRADAGSLRTLFVTLFFASVGMLGNPAWVSGNWHLVLGAFLLVVVGKALVVWLVLRLLGYTHGIAAATGLCLAQVGEFSFLLAETAHRPVPLIDADMFRLMVSVTITTLFVTPFLVAAAPRVGHWIESRRKRLRGLESTAMTTALDESEGPPPPDIVIIGFGAAGQSATEALYRHHHERITVIDLSPRNASIAHGYGLDVHIGDAMHPDVLERGRVANARVIAITLPDPFSVRTIIEVCRSLAPNATIVARARYHVRRWELEFAGAREVIDEEENVGLRIAASARKYLAPQEP